MHAVHPIFTITVLESCSCVIWQRWYVANKQDNGEKLIDLLPRREQPSDQLRSSWMAKAESRIVPDNPLFMMIIIGLYRLVICAFQVCSLIAHSLVSRTTRDRRMIVGYEHQATGRAYRTSTQYSSFQFPQ